MKKINFILVILILAILPLSIIAAEKNKKTDENLDLKSKSAVTQETAQKDVDAQKERTAVTTEVKPVNDTKSNTVDFDLISTDLVDNNTGSPVVNSPLAGEQINWQVLSSGATDAVSASYHLLGTLGQVAVGTIVSTNYSIIQGYWQDFGPTIIACCGQYASGFTGNANCDVDGKRNLADITRLIDHVYISKVELCCNENGNTNGDLDGKRNLADITRLIDHVYISKEPTAVCL